MIAHTASTGHPRRSRSGGDRTTQRQSRPEGPAASAAVIELPEYVFSRRFPEDDPEAVWQLGEIDSILHPPDLPDDAAADAPQRGRHLELCRAPLLTREQERALFLRMNYLKFRASAILSESRSTSMAQADRARVTAWLDESLRIRNRIVESNLRLVVALARDLALPDVPQEELISAVMPTLIRAVELFSVDSGNRFSTYATHSVRNEMLRVRRRAARRRQQATSTPPLLLEECVEDRSPVVNPEAWLARVRRDAARLLDALSRREQQILAARFGLGEHTSGHTYQEIGRLFGLSKERVRVVTHAALKKLRQLAEQHGYHPDGLAL